MRQDLNGEVPTQDKDILFQTREENETATNDLFNPPNTLENIDNKLIQ